MNYENIRDYFQGKVNLNYSDKDFMAMYNKSTTFFHRTLVLYTQYVKLKHVQKDNKAYIKDNFHYQKESFPTIEEIDLPHTFHDFIKTIVHFDSTNDTHVNILTSLEDLCVFKEAKIEHKKTEVINLSDEYDNIIAAIDANNEDDKRMTIHDKKQHEILLTLFSIAIHNIHPNIFHKEATSQTNKNTTKMTRNQFLNLFKRVLTCNEKYNPTILPSTEKK